MLKKCLFLSFLFLLSFTCCFAQSEPDLKLYDQAIELEMTDLNGAIEKYNELLKIKPDFTEGYVALGRCQEGKRL